MTILRIRFVFCDICNPECDPTRRDDYNPMKGYAMIFDKDMRRLDYGFILRNGKHICPECQEREDANGK